MANLFEQIDRLYNNQKLSSKQIAKHLGLSIWSVIYQMRKHNLPRRNRSETNQIRFLRKNPTFHKKLRLTSNDKIILNSAVMLYWAEGVKKSTTYVDFVNSDQKMILIFLTALRQIYKIDESKLRILLYCYPNQNSDELIKYWSSILKINKALFTKPYIRKQNENVKIHSMTHGIVHLRYHDKKLLMQIMNEVDIIQKHFICQGG